MLLAQILLTQLTRVSSLVPQRASPSFQPINNALRQYSSIIIIIIMITRTIRDDDLKEQSQNAKRVAAVLSLDQWMDQEAVKWKMWRGVTGSDALQYNSSPMKNVTRGHGLQSPLWPLSRHCLPKARVLRLKLKISKDCQQTRYSDLRMKAIEGNERYCISGPRWQL